jgi:hypothetical protein
MSDAFTRWPLVGVLAKDFPAWLTHYDVNSPFRIYGQLEFHRRTIELRMGLGSPMAAVADDKFLQSLYETLQAWGIGTRASRLKRLEEFCEGLRKQADAIGGFENASIDDPALNVLATAEALWRLIEGLPVVENTSVVVPATKTLHHLLPDLVVPMDREYTQRFFGWQNPQFQYGQRQCFIDAFGAFTAIARAVQPAQYVGAGWRTSRTKVIDNAVVGLIQHLKSRIHAQASPSTS